VEQGRVLGQVFVLRIPYTFPDRTETVSGIAGVGTRPDRRRAGVAREILTEIHRREKEAGIRFSTLWTNRSWGAHALYEKLGYRDVYSSPRGVRSARRSDLSDLEGLHSRQAEGRLGFLRNPNGYLSAAVATAELDPGKELIVARSEGRLRGYAHVETTPFRAICGELVATSLATRRSLISEVQRRARRRPFAFQHTPVTDSPKLFRGNGYSNVPTGWYVFMASSLGQAWTPRTALSEFATDDPRFLCMSGDRF
jgi:ribosomal protein S18 acetylase RimI-like enzyme